MGNDYKDSGSRAMLLGFEKSGKSTFLKRLIESQVAQQVEPQIDTTNGFDYVQLKIQGQYLDIWDVGGDSVARKFWSTFYRTIKIDYIIYFIDINKKETHTQTLKELIKLTNEEDLKKTRICILFNCFLDKNIFLDDKMRKKYELDAKKIIQELREFSIYKFDTRIIWILEDILKMNISDTFLFKCFGLRND